MTELEELLNLFGDAVPVTNPRWWAEANAYIAETYDQNERRGSSVLITDYYPTALQDDENKQIYLGFKQQEEEEAGR